MKNNRNMKENGHMIFNGIIYCGVIAYILYINFAAYYNTNQKTLNNIAKVFNNWIFRLVLLLVIGFFALDVFKYGGFTLAVLLTIAFLNTNMLIYKNEVNETFATHNLEKQIMNEQIMGQNSSNLVGEEIDSEMQVNELSYNNLEEKEPKVELNNNCGPYAPTYKLPFNPQAYRPDFGQLGDSIPDNLPVEQPYNGNFSQSPVGYDFQSN